MTARAAAEGPFSRRTAWVRNVPTPLREFLSTETGGAAVLLAATIAALAWVNIDASSYNGIWETTLSINLGDAGVALDLRHWVNSGLMTFFFFVVGLEARREFDLGELRERRRFALPLLAAIGGMAHGRRHLPRLQRQRFLGQRLGDRDVDGHSVRIGPPGAVRAPRPRSPAGVHPHRGRGRRHPRPRCHRHRLHRDSRRLRSDRARRRCSRRSWSRAPCACEPG